QQDMWDMKPDAPEGVRSLFQPIRTVVPGIEICDQMPLLARQTDKLAIIRSMTHDSDNHEPSVYHVLTGQIDSTLVVPRNQRTRPRRRRLPRARLQPPRIAHRQARLRSGAREARDA